MSTSKMTTQNRASSPERVQQQRRAIAPFVDVYENAEKLLLVADLPGVKKEDVAVSFENGQLTIEARRSETVAGSLLASEFKSIDYRRAFAVPNGIDADQIVAELEAGVLRLHLPKSAALRPRRIEIRS